LGGGGENFFPTLKVPRQCPLVFLVKICLSVSKALGSENGKGLKAEFVINTE
jgi:hypothetical protein